ncbi:MAG: helix-turn-helix domain-containing protein [Proteobacteria bacterium]|nr:helix-turn-helix domain-containing protein [Pseudomonadota bacterium]
MTASPPTSRAIGVLEALAASPEGLSSSAVARRLGLTTSTVALILATLDELAYVERQPDKSYRLGAGVLRLLSGVQSRFPLLGAAHDELARLSARVGCGCALARIGRDSQEVILTIGDVAADLGIRPGVRLTLDPPHGLVAMAWRGREDVKSWLASAPEPLSGADVGRQRRLLADIAAAGFAVYGVRHDAHAMVTRLSGLLSGIQHAPSANVLQQQLGQLASVVGAYTAEELATRRRRSVSYVLAPVFGPESQPRYLVSLQVMRDSVGAEELDDYVRQLLHSTQLLTAQIGGRAPRRA